jgi:hypothetical protein
MFKLSKSKKLNLLAVYEKTKHIYDDLPFVKKRRALSSLWKFLKYFSVLMLIFLVFFILFFSTYVKEFHSFYNLALEGKRNIEKAITLIFEGNYKGASEQAALAEKNFYEAGEIAKKHNDNFILKYISYFETQLKDIGYLVYSAEIVSRAVSQASDFAENLELILVKKEKNFNQLAVEDKIKLLKLIYQSSPELTGIKANIDLALINLDNISFSGVLLPFKPKILELEEKLLVVDESLGTIIPLTSFVPIMLGYPEKANFLFILQNSDELRPTGGFIGTYGILETEYGDILRFDTNDVYHLDMPVKDLFKKEPPAPLKQYLGVDNWYLRDANWSPDWPTSAKLIQEFFYAEDALLPEKDQINKLDGKFQGVIAITPELIINLLELTGPVYVSGEEFNQHNFMDLLQYKVEQEYILLGISSWHRKAVIGEIVKELKIRLFDLEPVEMYRVLDIFNTAFIDKNVLLYFNDLGFQEIVHEKGWSGNVRQVDSDYLMVVDANMASYKTDAVISRGIFYKAIEEEGGILANLTLNYAHHGDFDWKTTRYRTYTRVYVPRGSQLIKADGVEGDKVEVYDELGKTVFAFFISLEPGGIKNVNFNYRLPDKIKSDLDGGRYSLYVQKQPGNSVEQMVVGVDFDKDISAYQPTGFFSNRSSKKSLNWEIELKRDSLFTVELKK